MSVRLAGRRIRAVLLDIEGTTTPIAFVHEVLFPYARAHLGAYLRARRGTPEVAEVAARLAAEHAQDLERGEHPPEWTAGPEPDAADALATYAEWLMDRDRKSPGLKLLQGAIWEGGYLAGELRGQVFPDVAPALRRWQQAGLTIAIYSSGSVLAQRRLFESTPDGDLTPLLSGFFDTGVGGKMEADSYRRIAAELRIDPSGALFISDNAAELAAARAAGFDVVMSVRPGNPPQPDEGRFERIADFGEIT